MYPNFNESIILVSCLPGLGMSELAIYNDNVIDYEDWLRSKGSVVCMNHADRNILNDLVEIIAENQATLKKGCIYIMSSMVWEHNCTYYFSTSVYIHMSKQNYNRADIIKRNPEIDISVFFDEGVTMNNFWINRKKVIMNRHYELEQNEVINLDRLLVFCDDLNVYKTSSVITKCHQKLESSGLQTNKVYSHGN